MKKKIFSTLLLVAFTLASTSMFVSCKDYDDDINTNADAIKALQDVVNGLDAKYAGIYQTIAVETQHYNTLVGLINGKQDAGNYATSSDLQTSLANLKTNLENAIANGDYATNSSLKALEETLLKLIEGKQDADNYATTSQLDELRTNLETLISSMIEAQKIDEVKADVEALQKTVATQEALNELATKVAGIDDELAKKLADYATINYVDAVKENVQNQIDVLNAFRKVDSTLIETLVSKVAALEKGTYDDTELRNRIKYLEEHPYDDSAIRARLDTLGTALNALRKTVSDIKPQFTDEEAAQLKVMMETVNKLANNAITNANILQVLLDKQLTSIVLRPKLYLGGIEALEVPTLVYQPVIAVTNAGKSTEKWLFKKSATANSNLVYGTDDPQIYELLQSLATLDATSTVEGKLTQIANTFKNYYTIDKSLEGTAYFRLNPTSVKWDKSKFSLDVNNAVAVLPIESRSNQNFATLTNVEAAPAEGDGVVAASVKLNAPRDYAFDVLRSLYIYTGFEDASSAKVGTVSADIKSLSLEYKLASGSKDTIVASDWVAVAPTLLHINALSDNKPAGAGVVNMPKCSNDTYTGRHLFPTFEEARTNDATHTVYYKTETGIDLRKFVETHYSYITYTGHKFDQILDPLKADGTRDETLLNKLGLHYEYTAIQYESEDVYKTREDLHIAQDATTPSIWWPKSVEANTLNQIDPKEEAVNRKPIIRVTLTDGTNVYEVGYIKLEIVDEEPEVVNSQIPAIDMKDLYMNCAGNGALTWDEFEYYVLRNAFTNAAGEAIGMSKTRFESNYELYIDPATGKAAQYKLDGNKVTLKTVNNTDLSLRIIGDVVYTTEADPNTHGTNVLKWNFATSDIANVRAAVQDDANGNSTKVLNTAVVFVKTGTTPADGSAIYVPLNYAVGKIHFAIATKPNKLSAYWYQDQSPENATDDSNHAELHMNVWTPAQAGATYNLAGNLPEFKNYLENYFIADATTHLPKAVLNNPSKFNNVDATLTFEFYKPAGTWTVKGASGASYALELSADKKIIQTVTGKTPIVKLYTETVSETYGGTTVSLDKTAIEYQNNDKAKDILNYAGLYNANGTQFTDYLKYLQTFTAYVQMKVGDEANCYDVKLADNQFRVRFLRPISLASGNAEIQDGTSIVQKIMVKDILKVIDWRNYDVLFKGTATSKTAYPSFAGAPFSDAVMRNGRNGAEVKAMTEDYYGITAVTVDLDNVLCDVNMTREDRQKEVDPNAANNGLIAKPAALELALAGWSPLASFDATVAAENLATDYITYNNTGANVAQENYPAHIYIPVTVVYSWGTQTVYAKVSLVNTVAQAKRR